VGTNFSGGISPSITLFGIYPRVGDTPSTF
jgi:hypothetical protein